LPGLGVQAPESGLRARPDRGRKWERQRASQRIASGFEPIESRQGFAEAHPGVGIAGITIHGVTESDNGLLETTAFDQGTRLADIPTGRRLGISLPTDQFVEPARDAIENAHG
jgi:hypothetical protein